MDEFIQALHDAARRARGGIEGIANRTGRKAQPMRNRLCPGSASAMPTIADLVAVVNDTGDLAPIEALCRLLGGRFASRTVEARESVVVAAMHATAEHGDVARAVQEALANDNEIDAGERMRINREIAEERHALAVLENTVNALATSES